MTQPHLNKEQLHELYSLVADGINRIHEQSLACGNDSALNPARIYMVALAGYLEEHEILDTLNGYAAIIEDPSILEDFTPEKLPVV